MMVLIAAFYLALELFMITSSFVRNPTRTPFQRNSRPSLASPSPYPSVYASNIPTQNSSRGKSSGAKVTARTTSIPTLLTSVVQQNPMSFVTLCPSSNIQNSFYPMKTAQTDPSSSSPTRKGNSMVYSPSPSLITNTPVHKVFNNSSRTSAPSLPTRISSTLQPSINIYHRGPFSYNYETPTVKSTKAGTGSPTAMPPKASSNTSCNDESQPTGTPTFQSLTSPSHDSSSSSSSSSWPTASRSSTTQPSAYTAAAQPVPTTIIFVNTTSYIPTYSRTSTTLFISPTIVTSGLPTSSSATTVPTFPLTNNPSAAKTEDSMLPSAIAATISPSASATISPTNSRTVFILQSSPLPISAAPFGSPIPIAQPEAITNQPKPTVAALPFWQTTQSPIVLGSRSPFKRKQITTYFRFFMKNITSSKIVFACFSDRQVILQAISYQLLGFSTTNYTTFISITLLPTASSNRQLATKMQTETTKGTIPTDVFAAVILVNYSQFSETTSFASGRELQVFLNYSADSGLLQESIRLTSLQNSNPDLTWTVVCPNSACDFDHSTTSSGTASGTNGPILQLRCSDLDRSQAWQRYFGCPQSHGTALTPYLLWLLFLLLAWVLVLFWALHFLLVKWLFPTDRDKAVAPLNRVRAKQCVLAVVVAANRVAFLAAVVFITLKLDLETFACVEFASQTDFWNPILNFVDAALYPLLTIVVALRQNRFHLLIDSSILQFAAEQKRTLRRMELTQLATQAVCMGFIFFGLVVTIQNVSTVHPSAPATESSLKIYSLISLYGFSAVILFTKMLSLSVVIGAVEGVATGREWGGSSSRMTHSGSKRKLTYSRLPSDFTPSEIDFLSEYGGDVSEDVKNESIDPEGESDEEVHSSNSLRYSHLPLTSTSASEERTVVPPYSTESMEVCLPEPQPRDGQGAVGRREVIQFKENASVVLTTILLPILTILATALFTMNIAALTLTLDSIFVNSLLLFFVVLSTFTSVSIIGSEHITRASTSSPPDPDPGPGPRQTGTQRAPARETETETTFAALPVGGGNRLREYSQWIDDDRLSLETEFEDTQYEVERNHANSMGGQLDHQQYELNREYYQREKKTHRYHTESGWLVQWLSASQEYSYSKQNEVDEICAV